VRWLIKNPAPEGAEGRRWGDFHFGRGLAAALESIGQQVDTDYWGAWDAGREADVVLVLRGRRAWRPEGDCLKVLWLISHPEEVSDDELGLYDLVLVASEKHAAKLKERLSVPVEPLLQAVDGELFSPRDWPAHRPRDHFVFVGNTRNEPRESVLWAAEAGLPLKVWGKGWERWIDSRFIAGDYLDYRKLPAVFAAAKATLNDHWPEMSRLGYVNNRVFEALACGLPVISDFQKGLSAMFEGAVLTFKDRDQFQACLQRVWLEYPVVRARAERVAQRVAEEHSFAARARSLLQATEGLRAS